MPRKSKAFLRRSRAAKLGWKRRRARKTERSEAAKRGWRTQRRKQKKTKPTLEYVDVIGIDSLYA